MPDLRRRDRDPGRAETSGVVQPPRPVPKSARWRMYFDGHRRDPGQDMEKGDRTGKVGRVQAGALGDLNETGCRKNAHSRVQRESAWQHFRSSATRPRRRLLYDSRRDQRIGGVAMFTEVFLFELHYRLR